MEQILKSVLLLSCVGGVLTGLVLLLKPIAQKAFSPRWQYWVWICVLVVMVLPVRIHLPASAVPAPRAQAVHTLQQAPVSQTDTQEGGNTGTQAEIQLPSSNKASDIWPNHLMLALSYVWLFGALFSFGWSLVQYWRFLFIIRKNSSPVTCEKLYEAKSSLHIRRHIQVRISDTTTAPLLVGLFRATLLLPNEAMVQPGLEDILCHELIHLRHQDIACKWFALLVRCIHWFNPFVYLACKQVDESCEISCDFSVTGNMDAREKRQYMSTILSLAAPQKARQLTTSMASSKKQIERRFTMMLTAKRPSRITSFLSIVVAATLVSASVLVSGVAASAAQDTHKEKTSIEVFNGDVSLKLTNKPFIQNDEIYLPLRETLSNFGVTDIHWDNGQIDITLPLAENYKGGVRQESSCRIIVGTAVIWYGEQVEANGYKLRFAPISKDGVTYATVELFENLAFHGQMTEFRVRLKQSSDPKDYYTEGEEVYIGTGEEQDRYRPVDENGNRRYVKRIVTNEKGEAMYVVTAENQRPKVITSINSVNSSSMQGYSKGSEGRSRTFYTNAQGVEIVFSSGIFVYERIGENEFADIAYIPPALQINCCAYNQYKLVD